MSEAIDLTLQSQTLEFLKSQSPTLSPDEKYSNGQNDGTGHSSAEYSLEIKIFILAFAGLMLSVSLVLMFATYCCEKCRKYVPPEPKEKEV